MTVIGMFDFDFKAQWIGHTVQVLTAQVFGVKDPSKLDFVGKLVRNGLLGYAEIVATTNPNTLRTLQIFLAKNKWLEQAQLDEAHPDIEFTVYDVMREAAEYDPALADWKVAKRHLEAEVALGHLDKREVVKNGRRITVYVKRPDFDF